MGCFTSFEDELKSKDVEFLCDLEREVPCLDGYECNEAGRCVRSTDVTATDMELSLDEGLEASMPIDDLDSRVPSDAESLDAAATTDLGEGATDSDANFATDGQLDMSDMATSVGQVGDLCQPNLLNTNATEFSTSILDVDSREICNTVAAQQAAITDEEDSFWRMSGGITSLVLQSGLAAPQVDMPHAVEVEYRLESDSVIGSFYFNFHEAIDASSTDDCLGGWTGLKITLNKNRRTIADGPQAPFLQVEAFQEAGVVEETTVLRGDAIPPNLFNGWVRLKAIFNSNDNSVQVVVNDILVTTLETLPSASVEWTDAFRIGANGEGDLDIRKVTFSACGGEETIDPGESGTDGSGGDASDGSDTGDGGNTGDGGDGGTPVMDEVTICASKCESMQLLVSNCGFDTCQALNPCEQSCARDAEGTIGLIDTAIDTLQSSDFDIEDLSTKLCGIFTDDELKNVRRLADQLGCSPLKACQLLETGSSIGPDWISLERFIADPELRTTQVIELTNERPMQVLEWRFSTLRRAIQMALAFQAETNGNHSLFVNYEIVDGDDPSELIVSKSFRLDQSRARHSISMAPRNDEGQVLLGARNYILKVKFQFGVSSFDANATLNFSKFSICPASLPSEAIFCEDTPETCVTNDFCTHACSFFAASVNDCTPTDRDLFSTRCRPLSTDRVIECISMCQNDTTTLCNLWFSLEGASSISASGSAICLEPLTCHARP